MQFSRMRRLVGDEAIEKLKNARVIVFGIGGVGSFAAEAIARAGVGRIELVDSDAVSETNLNRQLVALHSTLGSKKTEVMRERILDINPAATVIAHDVFFSADSVEMFDFTQYSYVVDAIDTVTSKLLLIEKCAELGAPIISSMGTGNKLDPAALEVADIYKTSGCPLARIMRKELKKRGVERLKVVYSKEEPLEPIADTAECADTSRRAVPGSMPFVPPVAGMILAGEVIKDIIGIK